jgi:biopolymer transport protein TolQ
MRTGPCFDKFGSETAGSGKPGQSFQALVAAEEAAKRRPRRPWAGGHDIRGVQSDMPTEAVTQAVLTVPTSGDISLVTLFLQAHIVVKVVIVGLLLASVWSWAIIVDKTLLYGRVRRQMDRFEKVFWSGQSLEDLYRSLTGRTPTAMASVFVAAMREWKRSFEAGARSPIGLQTRIDKVLDVTIGRETERLERRLLFLATVGSAAPFIGLFGTVWGIMSSFQAIAASKNTALAIVAPGIAEALLATALGLLAAIPAVIAYNKLSSEAGKIGQRLEGFADEFAAILSRQVDERT